jgi:hypothetical protein
VASWVTADVGVKATAQQQSAIVQTFVSLCDAMNDAAPAVREKVGVYDDASELAIDKVD